MGSGRAVAAPVEVHRFFIQVFILSCPHFLMTSAENNFKVVLLGEGEEDLDLRLFLT